MALLSDGHLQYNIKDGDDDDEDDDDDVMNEDEEVMLYTNSMGLKVETMHLRTSMFPGLLNRKSSSV